MDRQSWWAGRYFKWSYKLSSYCRLQYQITSDKRWSCTKGRRFLVISKKLDIGPFVHALYNWNLQHDDTPRKAFSRTDTLGLPFLFCARKSLDILTHSPSSLLNTAIFMMQTLECRAAFVGLLQLKCMSSVWPPHLFFQIQVQARMVQTQSLLRTWRMLLHLHKVFCFPRKEQSNSTQETLLLKNQDVEVNAQVPRLQLLPTNWLCSGRSTQREICLFWNWDMLPSV